MGEIADAQIDRILNMKSPAGYMPRHNKKGSNQMSNNVNNPCKVITGKCRLSYAHTPSNTVLYDGRREAPGRR